MYQQPYGYLHPNPYYGYMAHQNPAGTLYPYPPASYPVYSENPPVRLRDYGPDPFVININQASKLNRNYRTTLWTGRHMQITLMSLNPGEDIGLEIHPKDDQFLRIEQGQGVVQMGKRKDRLDYVRNVYDDSAIMVPAGTWHNLTNTGNIPLKLYSIYAPPHHPFNTVHPTKADAMAGEQRGRQNTGSEMKIDGETPDE